MQPELAHVSPVDTGEPERVAAFQQLLNEVMQLANRLRRGIDVTPHDRRMPASAAAILLSLADRGPMTVPGIARLRNTSRQNVQLVINRFLREGWVSILDNPAHKRSPLVCLTKAGKELSRCAGNAESTMLLTAAAQIPDEELNKAMVVLNKVRRALADNSAAYHPSRKPYARPRRPARTERKGSRTPGQSESSAEPMSQEEVGSPLPVNLL